MLKKFVQQGRRRVETRGVPSGVRWGFRWAENEAGRLFQHPARSAAHLSTRVPASQGDVGT